jgi:DNA-binding winged helix-turn-helix (wHTH) protein
MTLHALGPFSLDARTMILLREGEMARVPMKTVEVLHALLLRRGEIVTKDELMKTVWPDSIVEEGNLTVHVALLRKVLGADAPIETIPKRGYRLLKESAPEVQRTETQRQSREAVLRGRYFWNKFTRSSLERASVSFEDALRLESGSGEAHSGLCDTRLMQGLFGFTAERSVFTSAHEHGQAAVSAAPESADAQASLAFSALFDRFDFATAGAALDKARALAPARVEPHLWSALFHALRGDTLKALAAAREAMAIDPISLKAVVGSGFHLYLSQQYEPDLEPLVRSPRTGARLRGGPLGAGPRLRSPRPVRARGGRAPRRRASLGRLADHGIESGPLPRARGKDLTCPRAHRPLEPFGPRALPARHDRGRFGGECACDRLARTRPFRA